MRKQLEEGDFDSDFRLVYLTQNELAEVQKNIASNSEIEEFRVEPFQANPSQETNETLKQTPRKNQQPKPKKQ